MSKTNIAKESRVVNEFYWRWGMACPSAKGSSYSTADLVTDRVEIIFHFKEVELSESKARELYRDTIILMRRMFHECRLVHADLSEFNML